MSGWDVGVNDGKSIKDFTSKEWGCHWFKSSQKLAFWKLIQEMVLRGTCSRQAIDRACGIYG